MLHAKCSDLEGIWETCIQTPEPLSRLLARCVWREWAGGGERGLCGSYLFAAPEACAAVCSCVLPGVCLNKHQGMRFVTLSGWTAAEVTPQLVSAAHQQLNQVANVLSGAQGRSAPSCSWPHTHLGFLPQSATQPPRPSSACSSCRQLQLVRSCWPRSLQGQECVACVPDRFKREEGQVPWRSRSATPERQRCVGWCSCYAMPCHAMPTFGT